MNPLRYEMVLASFVLGLVHWRAAALLLLAPDQLVIRGVDVLFYALWFVFASFRILACRGSTMVDVALICSGPKPVDLSSRWIDFATSEYISSKLDGY